MLPKSSATRYQRFTVIEVYALWIHMTTSTGLVGSISATAPAMASAASFSGLPLCVFTLLNRDITPLALLLLSGSAWFAAHTSSCRAVPASERGEVSSLHALKRCHRAHRVCQQGAGSSLPRLSSSATIMAMSSGRIDTPGAKYRHTVRRDAVIERHDSLRAQTCSRTPCPCQCVSVPVGPEIAVHVPLLTRGYAVAGRTAAAVPTLQPCPIC